MFVLGLYTPKYHGLQKATIKKTEEPSILSNPIMNGLPQSFATHDEWYVFSRGDHFDEAKVMFYIEEGSLTPHDHLALGNLDARHLSLPEKKRHPAMWYRENEKTGARSFYTGLVHNANGAKTDFFKLVVLRSAEYVAGYNRAVPQKSPAFGKGNFIRVDYSGHITVASPFFDRIPNHTFRHRG